MGDHPMEGGRLQSMENPSVPKIQDMSNNGSRKSRDIMSTDEMSNAKCVLHVISPFIAQ